MEKSIECGNQYQNVIVCGCIWFYPNFLEDYLVYICRSKSKFIHTIKKTIESLSPRFATKYNKLSKDSLHLDPSLIFTTGCECRLTIEKSVKKAQDVCID